MCKSSNDFICSKLGHFITNTKVFEAKEIRQKILEKETLLSVEGYEKRFEFFFTFGRFFECIAFEVRVKEENVNSSSS